MKRMEEEDAREQAQMNGRIRQLEADLDSCNQMLLSWRRRMQELETTIIEERKLREHAEAEVAILRNGQKHGTDAVPLPPRKLNRQQHQAMVRETIDESQTLNPDKDVPLGCGKCSQDTRCECIEQAFDISDIAASNADAPSKRPHSPQSDGENKRLRQQEPQENEIDFTTHFSPKKPPNLITSASSTSISASATDPDPCGFCQDDTPCICAEMAFEAIKSEPRPSLSRIQSTTDQVPTDLASSSNPCINGPGTCAQCISDANSTLFCKSLAATRSNNQQPMQISSAKPVASPPPTPTDSNQFPDSIETPSNPQIITRGVTLSCADAYETLSRHPAFEQASLELSTWMPQLATVPGGKERTAFEVEAASVMGVLRFFDRRFGKMGEKNG